MIRSQSALEYLTTYGWAILIMGIVLSSFIYLGVFNPSTFVQSQCLLQADFTCLTGQLYQSGSLFVNIQQNTQHTITITGIGCNTNEAYSEMQSSNTVLPIGSNATFTVQCYNSTTAWTGSVGDLFRGYLMVNYTDSQTGFSKTTIGTLIEKVS